MAIDWNQGSSIFLGIITALATVALAYYAKESFKGVKDQMDLMFKQSEDMKRQADALERQSSFVRDQSIAMKSQAMIMKSQSDSMEMHSNLMLENMEYDRLVKKYERVNREMIKLVGPLFERRNDNNIFSLKYKRSARIITSPTSRVPDPSPNPFIYDFVSFWDSIEQNMYLNRSNKFQFLFNNYSANVRDFFQSVEGGVDEKRKQDLEDLFNRTRKPEFISEIEKRHLELSNELKDIESELSKKKIKEWNTVYAPL